MSEVAILENMPKSIPHKNIFLLTRHFDKNSKVKNLWRAYTQASSGSHDMWRRDAEKLWIEKLWHR